MKNRNQLHTKPQKFTVGTNALNHRPGNNWPEKICKINGKTIPVTMNPAIKPTKRVYFEWNHAWRYVDNADLYDW